MCPELYSLPDPTTYDVCEAWSLPDTFVRGRFSRECRSSEQQEAAAPQASLDARPLLRHQTLGISYPQSTHCAQVSRHAYSSFQVDQVASGATYRLLTGKF